MRVTAYRIVVCFTLADRGMRLVYAPTAKTPETAIDNAKATVNMRNATGWHAECHVPGIGWVVADEGVPESEAERLIAGGDR